MGPTPVVGLNYSGICLLRSENRPLLAVPCLPLDVRDAAEPAVPVMLHVAPRTAMSEHTSQKEKTHKSGV